MTDAHFANLIAAIRTGAKLNQPVAQGNVAVTLLQLANIAYFTRRSSPSTPPPPPSSTTPKPSP